VVSQYRHSLATMKGGLTISGGEPLVQHRFVLKLFAAAKQMGVHTALDSNGYLGDRLSDSDLSSIDLVLLDLKAMTPDLHRRLTGMDNQPVHAFARRLAAAHRPIWVRFVLVPGWTDDMAEVERIASFAAELGNVERVDVLPFHQLGRFKWEKLGMDYQLRQTQPPSQTLTDEAVAGYDPRTKMNPPLRSARDRDALIEAVVDGTLDCLATDHAPHTEIEKDNDFDSAPFGIVGLETALGVYLQTLVEPGHLSLAELLLRMTRKPYDVLGRPGGTLAPGAEADITVFDPARRWTVRASEFASKGRSTPFEGSELPGQVLLTLTGGRIVYRAELAESAVR